MFATKDLFYLSNYSAGIISYLNNTIPLNIQISNSTTFFTLLNITDTLLSLATYIDVSGSIQDVLNQLYARIFNANVTLDDNTRRIIMDYFSDIISDSFALPGLDPSLLLTTFSGDTPLNANNFGSTTASSNPKLDISLTFPSSKRSIRRILIDRFLAVQNKNVSTGINMASPSAIIPKEVSASLPSNVKFQMTFIRDPKVYIKPRSTYINSQVVTITAKASNITYNFPNGSSPINITIPWAYVPLAMPNGVSYQVGCAVYNYINSFWTNTNSCVITNSTNSYSANIQCSSFATYGVSCFNAKVNISNVFSTKNKTSNSSILSLAYTFILLLGFMLI
jgi:hypothetical protein